MSDPIALALVLIGSTVTLPGVPTPGDTVHNPEAGAERGRIDTVHGIADQLGQSNPKLTPNQAERIAEECYDSALARQSAADVEQLCTGRLVPIFITGGGLPEPASEHDLAAIKAHPQWASLNYTDLFLRAKPTWKDSYPSCSPNVRRSGLACDEYPFLSTHQGGPNGNPIPSLKLISGRANSSQGGSLGRFYQRSECRTSYGSEFAVVPIPVKGIPTISVCQ
jgi:hypothetical protein